MKLYKSRADLVRKNKTLYQKLIKHRPEILNKFFPRENRTFSLETCIEIAKNFKNVQQWRELDASAYVTAKNNGWVNICREAMGLPPKTRRLWSKEETFREAQKYQTRIEWKTKSASSYSAAHKNGWFLECSGHMKKLINRWTLSACLKDAKRFGKRREWLKGSPGAYQAAYKNNWMTQCCKHMKFGNKRFVLNLDTLMIFDSIVSAGASIGKDPNGICAVLQKRLHCKTAGGYRWTYCDEYGNVLKSPTSDVKTPIT